MILFPVLSWNAATSLAADELFENASEVLLRRCVTCHHAENRSGGLRLDEADAFEAGGDSGSAIDAGDSSASYLIERIDAIEMPPPEKGQPQPLSAQERQALAAWIDAGAVWPSGRVLDPFEATTESRAGRDWWSFQPLQSSATPQVFLSDSRNWIDGYIDQQLQLAGISPAESADRASLLRRLTFDLTGLPPDAIDRDQFLNDSRPDAYERQVDRLLASPRFGERWGRLWLDAVRYADTSGYERDQEKPFAWRYRDWVIDAINSDKPFDRFVFEQLAGDELPEADRSTLIATGMLRLGTWNDEPNDPNEYQYERLEDLVNVTFSSFLALTVKCARCHDHKFDPIPQTDYYRVANAFWSGYVQPSSSDLLGGPPADALRESEVLAWTDRSNQVTPLHRLAAGDPSRPVEVVSPGHLTLLPELDQPIPAASDEMRTTGLRTALAQWMVSPDNPLAPRVFLNRIWQGHFGYGLVRSPDNFGFLGERPTHPELLDRLAWLIGRSDSSSSSPDDISTDGTLKRIHRLMVTSAAYRRSTEHPNAIHAASIDAANRLLWRGERRRLDAEGLRDALLSVSGELDLRMRGPGFRPTLASEALEGLSRRDAAWTPSPVADQRRRAVYEYSSRSLIDPLLTTFDFVDTTLPCARRDESIVAPQALALLNDPFVQRLAERTVDDLLSETSDSSLVNAEIHSDSVDLEALRIEQLWQRTMGRAPTPEEIEGARQHLHRIRQRLVERSSNEVENKNDLAIDRESNNDSAQPSAADDSWPAGVTLALLSDQGVEVDSVGNVVAWRDQSGKAHDAIQALADHQPVLINDAGIARIELDGQNDFLQIEGSLLDSQEMTLFAVVTDQGSAGLREILSNWNGSVGNSGSSVFFGLSGSDTLRWTDDAPAAGVWSDRLRPTLFSASTGPQGAWVHQADQPLFSRSHPLSERRLDTDWVVGTQGNINGEYWHGSVSALLAFNRQLSDEERRRVGQRLAKRFNADWSEPVPVESRSIEQQTWESLVVVLVNANEFLFVD